MARAVSPSVVLIVTSDKDGIPLAEGSGYALALCKSLIELVDLVGFEPTTSSMLWKRAPNCATGPLRKDNDPAKESGPHHTILAYWLRLVKRRADEPEVQVRRGFFILRKRRKWICWGRG